MDDLAYVMICRITSKMSVSTGIARANMMILPAISTLEPIAVSPASLHREAANSQIKLMPITFSTTDSISFASPACAAMPLNAATVSLIGYAS